MTNLIRMAIAAVALFLGASSALARMEELPFTIPSRETLAASPRQVLAHWHLLPLYWRNNSDAYAAWLLPTGKFEAVGGRWRDRPFPFDNTNLTNARRVAAMYDDISDAADIGIDAFVINVPYGPTDFRWNEQLLPMYDAADQFNSEQSPGFKVSISLSAFQIASRIDAEALPETWADRVAPFMDRSSYYQFEGKPVVAVYHVTQLAPAWYQAFADRLSTVHGKDVYLFPSYQGNNITELNPYAVLVPELIPFLHVWSNTKYTVPPADMFGNFRTWASSNGARFMGSMKHNTHRADTLKVTETHGFEQLQQMWLSSIENGDEIVQIITWNDHTENHNIRPSTGYQYVPYDISAYYITYFKTGVPPPIVRDVLYYAHRMHRSSEPRDPVRQPNPFVSQMGLPFIDDVVVLSFLKAPANVHITSGGQLNLFTNTPAGVSLRRAPLFANDIPRFKVTRKGKTVVPQFSSAFRTRSPIVWQDLQYRMGGSSRPIVPAVQNNLPQDR